MLGGIKYSIKNRLKNYVIEYTLNYSLPFPESILETTDLIIKEGLIC